MILTGGRSRRMGQDKAGVDVGGRTLLERVVEAASEAAEIVVVGPPPPDGLAARVRWTREDPPGSGPAAGLVAALPLVRTPALVALATDLPFVAGLPPILAARLGQTSADAVVPIDASGREQPLCAAYRTAVLREAAARLGDPAGASMRALVGGLRVDRLAPPPATVDPTTDVDTPDELARARGAWKMKDWIEAVRRELAIDSELDVTAILDVARDAAHQVQRPAAPLTTYLLGVAVGSGLPLTDAAARISRLAADWPASDTPASDAPASGAPTTAAPASGAPAAE